MNTWYLSFGSLNVGERFRFSTDFTTFSTYVKLSPRRYRCENGPTAGRVFQTSVRSAVIPVRD